MEVSLTFTRTQNRGGESVVFLHAVGTNGWMWKSQQQALSDYDCFIPDLPGHGRNNHIRWISIQETARLIAALIAGNANGGQAHLVGISLGAYVVMEILANHRNVVRRAVISGLNVLPPSDRFFRKIFGDLFTPLAKTKLVTRFNIQNLSIPKIEHEIYGQSVQQVSTSALRTAKQDIEKYKLPENAAAIQTPTLVVAGSNEPAQVLDSVNTITNTLPFAQGFITPFTGSLWNLEKPEIFSDVLKAWFRNYPIPDSLIPAASSQTLEAELQNQSVNQQAGEDEPKEHIA